MTLETYISYFENLARASRDILHRDENNRVSFFVVENPFDNGPIDNALRSSLQPPAMLLDIPEIQPSDNGSNNPTDTLQGTFAIVKESYGGDLTTVRSECLEIGKRILFRMHYDYKRRAIDPGKMVHFTLSDCEYSPIGPMAANFYGYLFAFRFTCPFQTSVSDEFWQDLDTTFPFKFPIKLT